VRGVNIILYTRIECSRNAAQFKLFIFVSRITIGLPALQMYSNAATNR